MEKERCLHCDVGQSDSQRKQPRNVIAVTENVSMFLNAVSAEHTFFGLLIEANEVAYKECSWVTEITGTLWW